MWVFHVKHARVTLSYERSSALDVPALMSGSLSGGLDKGAVRGGQSAAFESPRCSGDNRKRHGPARASAPVRWHECWSLTRHTSSAAW